jgi:hypothetical protein
MIDIDYGPGVLACVIALAYLAPILYSFFVDHFDKKTPPIIATKSKKQ